MHRELTHYYVWYRIEGDAAAARAAVDAAIRDVSRECAVLGRVLVRRDEPLTWMEIYESVTDSAAFEVALAAATVRHDLARFTAGGVRHVEAFV